MSVQTDPGRRPARRRTTFSTVPAGRSRPASFTTDHRRCRHRAGMGVLGFAWGLTWFIVGLDRDATPLVVGGAVTMVLGRGHHRGRRRLVRPPAVGVGVPPPRSSSSTPSPRSSSGCSRRWPAAQVAGAYAVSLVGHRGLRLGARAAAHRTTAKRDLAVGDGVGKHRVGRRAVVDRRPVVAAHRRPAAGVVPHRDGSEDRGLVDDLHRPAADARQLQRGARPPRASTPPTCGPTSSTRSPSCCPPRSSRSPSPCSRPTRSPGWTSPVARLLFIARRLADGRPAADGADPAAAALQRRRPHRLVRQRSSPTSTCRGRPPASG